MKKEFTFTTFSYILRTLLIGGLMLFYTPSFAQHDDNQDGNDQGEQHENHDGGGHDREHARHCEANFRHVRDTVIDGVLFFAAQHNRGTTYSWSFGDGSTSTLRNPEHVYTSSGTYYVCLTVTDSAHNQLVCTDTDCDSIRVQVICNANFRTVADSTFLGVHFIPAPNYSITTYSWDFGDGSGSTDASPIHIYADTGTYHVCLAVKDSTSQGVLCTDSVCRDIHIGVSCNAHFRAEMEGDEDDTTLVVSFRSARNAPGATYAWDFGDGSSSGLANPTHTYADTGSFVVCLTVTDSVNGRTFCQDTFCDTLHVMPGGDDDGHRAAAPAGSDKKITASIYPNPTRSDAVLHIENANGTATFKVYESTGRLVILKNLTSGDYALNPYHLTAGIYFYEVNDSYNIIRGKLIIQ